MLARTFARVLQHIFHNVRSVAMLNDLLEIVLQHACQYVDFVAHSFARRSRLSRRESHSKLDFDEPVCIAEREFWLGTTRFWKMVNCFVASSAKTLGISNDDLICASLCANSKGSCM